MLRDVQQGQDVAENSEDAFRVDFTYELDFAAFNSVDFGLRRNVSTSLRDEINSNVGLRSYADSPRGNLFADILVRGPDNFNEAD